MFKLKVRVVSPTKASAVDGLEEFILTLQVLFETSVILKAILTMHALSVLAASVTYYRRIELVTHPKVNLYKPRSAEVMAENSAIAQNAMDPDQVLGDITTYMEQNPSTRFVEILCYGRSTSSYHK
jgi:hypothetical protein